MEGGSLGDLFLVSEDGLAFGRYTQSLEKEKEGLCEPSAAPLEVHGRRERVLRMANEMAAKQDANVSQKDVEDDLALPLHLRSPSFDLTRDYNETFQQALLRIR